MTLPVSIFSVLILAALALSAVAPVVLLFLLVRDYRRGKLW